MNVVITLILSNQAVLVISQGLKPTGNDPFFICKLFGASVSPLAHLL